MGEYIRVVEGEITFGNTVELPIDKDGTILLSTIQAQFPRLTGLTGLRYRNEETQTWRAVRLADGVLYPPPGGWGSDWYTVVSSKTGQAAQPQASERIRMRSALLQQLKELKSLQDTGILETFEAQEQKEIVLDELTKI